MDVIFGHVVTVMLPVLLCVLLGYGLAVLRAPFDRKMFGSLVANVGYPALILSHLAKDHIELGAFLNVLLAAAFMMLIFGVLGFGILKLLGLPVQAYLSPMMLSNVGNIGLPVTTLAFGAEGAAVGVLEGDEIVYRVAVGTVEPFTHFRLKVDKSLTGASVTRDEVLSTGDTETDERVNTEATRKIGIRSMITVPLHNHERVAGALNIVLRDALSLDGGYVRLGALKWDDSE